ncbi:hypothetical protein Mhun_2356 [Methanospirillum hungatei JF-1]|uniref:Uncharacterized protein n=1 Tax=Methanospirillum hungatei JF-1 (strain ATCC 27890 / DSM 864 / NBRC 100397 / JF-1) TaxID=323259 RepID=Q2FSK7_METHJ|nr:hypothetical protein [Methanospirillum hungatei]ABD42060.1 hypothetical protein Mhun_2356 [Methanospirillum hungatei JF-1]
MTCILIMEEIIELGFNRLVEVINLHDSSIDAYSEEIRTLDAELLGKMAAQVTGVIAKTGIELLEKGKKDNHGEIYDPRHYPKKMIILGKSADPMPYRPDNMSRAVQDQFCLLGEDGKFYEIMYSADDLIIDSYLAEITPRQVIDLYGYEAMFMLYKAMQQYMYNQEELLSALETTLNFIRS